MRPTRRLQLARQLGETSLMFLVHPTLSEQDMLDTGRAVEKVLKDASIHLPVAPEALNSLGIQRDMFVD